MSKRRLSIIPARAVADRDLNETCLRVLGQIGTYTDNEGWCYPRQGEIGRELGIGRPAVNRAVAKLAECGYLEVHPQRRKDGGKAANLYRVVLDPPVEISAPDDAENSAPEVPEHPPHVPPAIQGVCASSDTYPDSATSTGVVSPGESSITSQFNESEIPEDARACSDTSVPRAFDPAHMALARLKAEIGNAAFQSWFKRVRFDPPDTEGGAVIVRAPSRFHANHIRQHFAERLERLLGRKIEIVAHGVRRSKAEKVGRPVT